MHQTCIERRKSHRPRDIGIKVSRKTEKGVTSRILCCNDFAAEQYNNNIHTQPNPRRIFYGASNALNGHTKSQNLCRIFFWITSLDGTIYLKLLSTGMWMEEGRERPIVILHFCILVLQSFRILSSFCTLLQINRAIVFIVFVSWNHETYFSPLFSFRKLHECNDG